MRAWALIALGVLAGVGATAVVGQNAPALAPAEFDLQVGKTVYAARVNQPLTITTPKGEKVPVTIRRKDVLRFQSPTLTFLYPRQMQVDAQTLGGVTHITVESVNSPLALLQVYPEPATSAQARRDLVEGLAKEFRDRGGRVSGPRPTRRAISGIGREGDLLEIDLAGSKLRAEVFAFPRGKQVVAAVFQHDMDDDATARRYFAIIADSLK
jgi:hypothetical protein